MKKAWRSSGCLLINIITYFIDMVKKKEIKVKPETLHYWETISAWVWKINPAELFEPSRAGVKSYARFFCLEFMHDRLGLTQETSARRYGQRHDAVVYAKKKNKELSSVDKFYKEKHKLFKEACAKFEEHSNIQYKEIPLGDYETRVKAFKDLAYQSWSNYASLMHSIKRFDEGKCDETEVFYQYILCEIDFNSMGKFFEK